MSPRLSSSLSRVGSLLRALREKAGLTQDALAQASGCSKAYLSLVESGQRTLSVERAIALEAALDIHDGRLQAALNWQRVPEVIRAEVERTRARSADMTRRLRDALAGERPLESLRELMNDGERDSAGSSRLAPTPLIMPMSRIPIINKVAAGRVREFTDLDQSRAFADEHLSCPDVSDPDAFAARVTGDSMEPEYFEGDVVVFSPLAKIDVAGGGGGGGGGGGVDCFVRLERDAESTFKRVYFEDDGRKIRLQPLNSAYPPVMVKREDVAGLYAAVYVLRKVKR